MASRPDGVNLTSAEKKTWTDLAKLEYKVSRLPCPYALNQLGIDQCFQELCREGQLTGLFMVPGPPSYQRLTLEFLSTLKVMLDKRKILGIKFQLKNRKYNMSIAQFKEVFGFTGEVVKEPFDFSHYSDQFWQAITATKEGFLASNAKATQIRNPVLRMLQKACACYPFARHEQGSVHREELFLLWTILHKQAPLNLGHYMIKHLERASKKKTGKLCVGTVVSAIALHLGVPTDDLVADVGGNLLDMTHLKKADMIKLDPRGRVYLSQRAKDHFPLPDFDNTYVNGPDDKGNWSMNTPVHKQIAANVPGVGRNAGPSSSSSEEEEEEEEEDEEEEAEEEQPESSSRAKRSRPRGNTSTADYLKDIAEGMSTIQLGQAQQDSRWDQLQQWHQEELHWRAQQESRLDLYGAQVQQLQTQNDERWTQQQGWKAEQDSRWGEQHAFMQAYYARFPPPSSD